MFIYVDASALSRLKLRIKTFKFRAGIVDLTVPINSALFVISLSRPSLNLTLKVFKMTDTSVTQTLPGQGTQFTLGDIEPSAMFRSVDKVDTFDILSGNSRFKGGIKSTFGMGIEIIAYEGNALVTVARLKQVSDFKGPIFFGALRSGRGLPKA